MFPGWLELVPVHAAGQRTGVQGSVMAEFRIGVALLHYPDRRVHQRDAAIGHRGGLVAKGHFAEQNCESISRPTGFGGPS